MLKNNIVKTSIIDIVMAPIMYVLKITVVLFYQITAHHRRLKSLKGKYEGLRCFIVGNGPSLSLDDLKIIEKEHCFGFNRILEVFDKTSWRPEFYFVLDRKIVKFISDNINKVDAKYKFLHFMAGGKGIKADSATFFVCHDWRYVVRKNSFVKTKMSKDISRYISVNYSVASAAIEIAIYLGFKEIILIGVDNKYSHWIDKHGKMHIDNIDDYKLTKPHDFASICHIDALNSCYEFYRKYADANGIKIYNATRGGCLEAFERKELEELL